MRTLAVVLLVFLLAVPALAAEKVTFTTNDGMKITGTLYPSGRKGAAGVVALPMYLHTRETYEPVAERFVKAGIDFLAIDTRGHGDSAMQGGEDLSERAKARDAMLFKTMWKDAIAAREFLISKGGDENRIGLLGASVGCSVAIAAASVEERIPGVCVMTPGKNYLGVDTMSHLPGYRRRPMLILTARTEARGGSTAIKEKLGSAARLVVFEQKDIHGTKMFGAVPEVESQIVRWFDGLLIARVALDGKLDEKERRRVGTWKGEDGREVVFYASTRSGKWWHVVAVPAKETPVPQELELRLTEGKYGWSIRWDAKRGTWLRQMLRDGKWIPYRTKAAPGQGPSAAQGKLIEILVPMRRGSDRNAETKICVTAKLGEQDVDSGWNPLVK